MTRSWNEIKWRAMDFGRNWGDAADEANQANPFQMPFLKFSSIADKRDEHEQPYRSTGQLADPFM